MRKIQLTTVILFSLLSSIAANAAQTADVDMENLNVMVCGLNYVSKADNKKYTVAMTVNFFEFGKKRVAAKNAKFMNAVVAWPATLNNVALLNYTLKKAEVFIDYRTISVRDKKRNHAKKILFRLEDDKQTVSVSISSISSAKGVVEGLCLPFGL